MHTTIYSISESPKNAHRDLGRHRRRQRAAHARRRRDLDRTSSATCQACPPEAWVSLGRGEPLRRRRRVRRLRPPHVRRHDARTSTGPTTYGQTWQRIAGPDAGRARLRARDQGGPRSSPTCSSSAPSSASGSRIDGGAHVGAVQGGQLPGRRGARPRGAPARPRPRHRHARPRHLDRRRHHAAARARRRRARRGGGVPPRPGPSQQRIQGIGGWA